MTNSSFHPPDNEATARRVMFEAQIAAEYAGRRESAGRTRAICVGVAVGLLISAVAIACEVLFT